MGLNSDLCLFTFCSSQKTPWQNLQTNSFSMMKNRNSIKIFLFVHHKRLHCQKFPNFCVCYFCCTIEVCTVKNSFMAEKFMLNPFHWYRLGAVHISCDRKMDHLRPPPSPLWASMIIWLTPPLPPLDHAPLWPWSILRGFGPPPLPPVTVIYELLG